MVRAAVLLVPCRCMLSSVWNHSRSRELCRLEDAASCMTFCTVLMAQYICECDLGPTDSQRRMHS